MRDRAGRSIWRAAAIALLAGAIVAYADPAPPIGRAAAADGSGFIAAARRFVDFADRTAAPSALRAAQARVAHGR